MKPRRKKAKKDYRYTKIIYQRQAFKELTEEVNRLKDYAASQDDLVVKLLAELIVLKHNKAYDLLPPSMKEQNL